MDNIVLDIFRRQLEKIGIPSYISQDIRLEYVERHMPGYLAIAGEVVADCVFNEQVVPIFHFRGKYKQLFKEIKQIDVYDVYVSRNHGEDYSYSHSYSFMDPEPYHHRTAAMHFQLRFNGVPVDSAGNPIPFLTIDEKVALLSEKFSNKSNNSLKKQK